MEEPPYYTGNPVDVFFPITFGETCVSAVFTMHYIETPTTEYMLFYTTDRSKITGLHKNKMQIFNKCCKTWIAIGY